MNTKQIKKDLKDITHAFVDEFNRTAQHSWEEQVKRMGPGSISPQKGRLFDNAERATFDAFAANQREKMRKAVSRVAEDLSRLRSEAPSTEAVNAVAMLGLRSNITEDEIYAAADRYGSNYMTYKAIRDIGVKQQIFLPEKHTVDQIADGLSSIDRIVDNMTTMSAENGRWGAGYSAMVDMTIDNAFPD